MMKVVIAVMMLLLAGCNNLSVSGNRVSYGGFSTTYSGDSSRVTSAISILKMIDYSSDDLRRLYDLVKEVK